MSLPLPLDIAVTQDPDRAPVGRDTAELITGTSSDLTDRGAGIIVRSDVKRVSYVGTGASCGIRPSRSAEEGPI